MGARYCKYPTLQFDKLWVKFSGRCISSEEAHSVTNRAEHDDRKR